MCELVGSSEAPGKRVCDEHFQRQQKMKTVTTQFPVLGWEGSAALQRRKDEIETQEIDSRQQGGLSSESKN